MARRRLRSSTVLLGGIGVLAVSLTSCGAEPDKRGADRLSQEQLAMSECREHDGEGDYASSAYGRVEDGLVTGGSFDEDAVERGGFGCAGSGGG
ncbi:hypothetical protein [Streptomyces sp. NBC_00690]|uniref:hypothetical protein n=1 Tax=Streptomyces sp. NBC_00690 TaxID=2975808 RepID=UPI002E2E26FE|nr:hypothetical protein [Streptomyces sp. NBC_00690]